VHQPLYLQGKSPWYPLDRRLSGSQSRSGCSGEEKNSQRPPGIEPQNPNCPARSPVLYQLSYHGSCVRHYVTITVCCQYCRHNSKEFAVPCYGVCWLYWMLGPHIVHPSEHWLWWMPVLKVRRLKISEFSLHTCRVTCFHERFSFQRVVFHLPQTVASNKINIIYSFVRQNIIIIIYWWFWRDICEHISVLGGVTKWSIQDVLHLCTICREPNILLNKECGGNFLSLHTNWGSPVIEVCFKSRANYSLWCLGFKIRGLSWIWQKLLGTGLMMKVYHYMCFEGLQVLVPAWQILFKLSIVNLH
jgi:hypothetical protein